MRLRQELREKTAVKTITETVTSEKMPSQNKGITKFLKRKNDDDKTNIVTSEEEINVDNDEIEIVNIESTNKLKKPKVETK